MTTAIVPMIGAAGFGLPELLIILAVLLLLFGAAKLPELAQGMGKALRVFKDETKGLQDDSKVEDPADRTDEPRSLTAGPDAQPPTGPSTADHDAAVDETRARRSDS